ncbi:MAG: hypothetical protein ACRD29_03260 [Acidimicrobiales bacterium]
MSSTSPRPEVELGPDDRQRLVEADQRLREAVKAYEPFAGRDAKPGQAAPEHDLEALADAQAAVEAAEDELWRLRDELLGWARPPWAPRAALVADWFSDEDAVYDDVDAGSSQQ